MTKQDSLSVSETAVATQVSYLNRPSHLNLFLSDSEEQPFEDAAARVKRRCRAYRRHFSAAIQGQTSLQSSVWVFLLCTALSMLVFRPESTGAVFTELRVRDAKQTGGKSTSQVNLIRWLDRLHRPGSRHRPAIARLMQMADPNAEVMGCDRLVWSRSGEEDGPKKLPDLSAKILHAAQLSGCSTKPGSKRTKERRDPDATAVTKIRTALDAFGQDRLRADDLYRGVAMCSIAPPDQCATPVRVLPVIGTERVNQWRPAAANRAHSAVQRHRDFEITQGYKLSSYYQFRLDLQALPRGYEVDL